MSKEPDGLDVSILGRQFRIACTDEERRDLLKAVQYLDERMRSIRDGGKVVGVERIAIMAALNIAHELLTTRIDGAFDIGDLKGRIKNMSTAIEQTLSAQDELF